MPDPDPVPERARGPARHGRRAVLATLVFCAAVIAAFLAFGDRIEATVALAMEAPRARWATAALVVAVLASDIALPIPSSLVGILAGAALPLPLAMGSVFAGLCAGNLAGYGAGRLCAAPGARAGSGSEAALVGLRAVPVLSEASAFAAGAAGMGLGRFALLVGLSNAGLAAAYALAGRAAAEAPPLAILLAASAALPLAALALLRIGRRQASTG